VGSRGKIFPSIYNVAVCSYMIVYNIKGLEYDDSVFLLREYLGKQLEGQA
jgi:hypothetical protein